MLGGVATTVTDAGIGARVVTDLPGLSCARSSERSSSDEGVVTCQAWVVPGRDAGTLARAAPKARMTPTPAASAKSAERQTIAPTSEGSRVMVVGEGLQLGLGPISAVVIQVTIRKAAEKRFGAVPGTSDSRARAAPDVRSWVGIRL